MQTTSTTIDQQNSPTMFPNHLHHNHHQSPPNSSVNHHLTTTTSDETDIKKEPNTTNDVESNNIVRRPRGRPPGSKNKSKSPVTLTCVTNKPDTGTLAPYVLEVSSGSDIVAAVRRFCNHRKTGLCLLNGSGAVSNVSFRQPTTTAVYHGCFNLVSISATILPPLTPSINGDFLANFVISLSCPQGRTFGGTIIGPLIASGTVYIVAAAFNNPIYHRLPMEEDDSMTRNGGHGSVSAAIDQQASGLGGGENGHHHHAVPLTMAGMLSTYPGDIWAPTPRQSQPHSSLYN